MPHPSMAASPLAVISLHDLPSTVLDPRIGVGALGVLLLLFGARYYRLVLVAPGFALGVLGGLLLTQSTTTNQQVLAALCLGLIGATALYFLERLAVSVVGAVLTAGFVRAGLPALLGEALPWYVPVAAGLLGLLLFPRLLRGLLKVLSPMLGALAVAFALGRSGDLWLILGLSAFGSVFQLAMGTREESAERA